MKWLVTCLFWLCRKLNLSNHFLVHRVETFSEACTMALLQSGSRYELLRGLD